jgi:hypothetical protein
LFTRLQGASTHGFVVEFENATDRNFYVEKDPVHEEFAKSMGPHVQDIRVVDYEPGMF